MYSNKPSKPAGSPEARAVEPPTPYRDRAAERRRQENDESHDDATAPLLDLTSPKKEEHAEEDAPPPPLGLDKDKLARIRQNYEALMKEQGERELEAVLDEMRTGEAQTQEKKVEVHSIMAKNIYDMMTAPPKKTSHELFYPGRMAFVFALAEDVREAYALPNTVIRSAHDAKRTWSEERKTESDLVMSKVADVLAKKHAAPLPAKKKAAAQPAASVPVSGPIVTFEGDIFADAGRDYALDEAALEQKANAEAAAPAPSTSANYFTGLAPDAEDEEEKEDVDMDAEVQQLLTRARQGRGGDGGGGGEEKDAEGDVEMGMAATKKRRHEEVDADANDIDMFGLSASALPTSFEEMRRNRLSDVDADGEPVHTMVDQGTHRNKKAQLTRWDFDDEEAWQKYKDSVEIQPKSASQYGVKLGDGRKRNREQKRGMSEKQKLNREYQQVKNIMDKKYGKKS